jgi:hypothetical protein
MSNVLNKLGTRNKRPLCVDVSLGPPELDASIPGQVKCVKEFYFYLFILSIYLSICLSVYLFILFIYLFCIYTSMTNSLPM